MLQRRVVRSSLRQEAESMKGSFEFPPLEVKPNAPFTIAPVENYIRPFFLDRL
jgi:hypothetical protein